MKNICATQTFLFFSPHFCPPDNMFCVFKLSYQHFSLHPYRLRRLKEETTNLFSLSRFLGYTAVKGVLNSGTDIVDVDMTSTLLNDFTFTNNYNFLSISAVQRKYGDQTFLCACLYYVTVNCFLSPKPLDQSIMNFSIPNTIS